MSKYNWKHLFHASGGHSYFKEPTFGMIAVADDSGPTPDTTEDGVCWLDTTRPVVASGTGFYIPIINKKNRTTTCATPTEAVQVCAYFKMKLTVDGRLFSLESCEGDQAYDDNDEDQQAHC